MLVINEILGLFLAVHMISTNYQIDTRRQTSIAEKRERTKRVRVKEQAEESKQRKKQRKCENDSHSHIPIVSCEL